jgi:hypothetical protein
MSHNVPDLRGQMFRAQRQMSSADARHFLSEQKIANIGTVDNNGWPYVVPLAFVYEGTEELWFHTGWHEGHLFHNLKEHPKLCLEVSGIGNLAPVKNGYACDSSLLYSSVIVFGTAEVVADDSKTTWFFDRMVAKYGDASLEFKPGYPMLNRIILFRMTIEIITGKHNAGMSH